MDPHPGTITFYAQEEVAYPPVGVIGRFNFVVLSVQLISVQLTPLNLP